MPRVTQLYDYHLKHAKLIEFAGYEMPVWYTTTTEEHLAVRNAAGIFDVSHMGRFEVSGPGAATLLERLLPTRVIQQPLGKAFYTLFLNDSGGIIDDLIVLKTSESAFTLVVNAANRKNDMDHIMKSVDGDVQIADVTDTTMMVALQGPHSERVLQPLTSVDLSLLKRFRCVRAKVMGQLALISRTGYTGEDGFEVCVYGPSVENPKTALEIWVRLADSSVPSGLGARDSLRLEAGLPLHGADIDIETNPFQTDLAWVISKEKTDYIGFQAIASLKDSEPNPSKVGLVLDRGIPRHGFAILDGKGSQIGSVTSGTYSPLLKKGIALCKVRRGGAEMGEGVKVVVRDKSEDGSLTHPPFYDENLYGWKRAAQR